ncbi:protein of unknown function [Salinimicrobium catena]|uniref:DUF4153 domain-containing protein n=1 Tax=Salinimicrobium catena TaxID=390640 RepID=A0A1H5NRV6_9FLAO|nr:DUF4153 domain-containing protein [Salinimicrobium catena]SDL55369.1 protein of unknown function [Salinimicrobium catena]SEF03581.1 protein of unknown function [Salinimicrobium catena]
MRDQIIAGLDSPAELERLYRKNKAEFRQHFEAVYGEYRDRPIMHFWQERLHYAAPEITWGSKKDLKFVILAAVIAGLLAKLPAITGIAEEFFYPRNIGFLTFPFLILFFALRNNLSKVKIAILTGITAASLLYINLLPGDLQSDTLVLACIHLPLLLWGALGISFTGNDLRDYRKRLDFLSFNGDLLVMCAMLVLAGIMLTGVTLGLFGLIGLQIAEFYFQNVVIFSLPAVPILATLLVQTNPGLVNKVSPVIAKIFSPVVLVMLLIYLGAIVYSGKEPYTDRDFLILFNLLLIGVMALIFFSVAKEDRLGPTKYILFPLSLVTILVNGIALSAIIYRIAEWGFTPNRLAVLGGNILILVHLFMVSSSIFKSLRDKNHSVEVGRSIVRYLPVYFVWIIIVVYLFPFIFGFK